MAEIAEAEHQDLELVKQGPSATVGADAAWTIHGTAGPGAANGAEVAECSEPFSGVGRMKEAAKAVFSMGDYRNIAVTLDEAARQTVRACAIRAGETVLDVGAGTGNAAIYAAGAGAVAAACDLTPLMVAWGRERSEGLGLDIAWSEADAEDLPFGDDCFDCTISVLGACMAPRPQVAAAELFRVVRPDGKVAVANWTHDSFPMRLGGVMADYLGRPSPKEAAQWVWGAEESVETLFAPWASEVRFERRALRQKHKSFEDYVSFNQANLGILVAARKMLGETRFQGAMNELREVALAENVSSNGALWIDCEYMVAVARKA